MKNITNTQNDFENKQSSKIIFDYGGPNIGKPLHVGHMPPGILEEVYITFIHLLVMR